MAVALNLDSSELVLGRICETVYEDRFLIKSLSPLAA